MVKVININASDCLSESECDGLKGTYMGDNSYETLVDEDCDLYCEGVPIFKFRKQVFQEDLLTTAWDNCKYMAKASRGRGASAGPIDPNSQYWKKRKIYWSNKWRASYMVKDKKTGEMKQSKMKVNNEVASQPIGFYGKTNGLGLDLPCRLSHYTRENLDKYHNAIPYFQAIANHYEDLLPDHFTIQMERAKLNDYHIEGTPFSTITINRNFRTAVHKDSGDFGGWACLSVLEENKYSGGYFVLPKFRIAIDMRHGDLLVCDVHQYHSNTELYESEEDKKYNDENPQQTYKDNLDVGILGLNNRFSRLSFVSYLREDIINCKSSLNKFFISMENSERLPKWKDSEYTHWRAVNGTELSLDCESCKKMVSYHNIRNTPQHLKKTACFLSHLTLLKHIWENKINNVIIVEDDALLINSIPENLPDDCLTYLGGFIANKKITSKEPIEIDHKEGLNTLDKSKYRMVCLLAYYIPKYEIAGDLYKKLVELKRWRAIDISLPNLLPEVKYIYPSVFIEEPSDSQIMNKKKKHFANEYYKTSKI
jgi:hypothetical protein